MHCSKPAVWMAFDFGLKRIGVAFGNGLTKTAQPVATIEVEDNRTRFEKIAELVKQWQPEGFVVGVPRHDDGSPNELTERCERFARQLTGRFELHCATVDERFSSVEAESTLGRSLGKFKKPQVDMASACLILEQFFLEGR